MAENSEINSTSYSANFSCVSLQTAKFILVSLISKRKIKVKTFDFYWDLVTVRKFKNRKSFKT